MSDPLEQMLSQPSPKLRPTPSPKPHIAPRADAATGTAVRDDSQADVPSAAKRSDRSNAISAAKHPDATSAAQRIDPAHMTKPVDAHEQLLTINLHKSYYKGSIEVPVLRNVGMSVRQGEFLAIVGQSGSGKSTLLHLLGTLDAPDQGEIHYAGRRIDNLPAKARDTLRNRDFGMIFQFYHLLPELNTLENVLTPLMIAHGAIGYIRHRHRHRARAQELLEMVGLGHRLKHRPRELSGGEMQRAAIARALVAEPNLLLADEPTGNLDQSTGQEIINILRTLNQQRNLTIVMVTHDLAIADQADRIVRLTGGQLEA
jgi:lipoprotein-releasing system ATP-binding protein